MVKATNIEEAIARIADWQGKDVTYEAVEGGITNPNFKVFVDGQTYFLKIPGAGVSTHPFGARIRINEVNVGAIQSV